MDFSNIGALIAKNVAKKPGVLDRVLDIAGSKGGQTLINAAGAGMQAYGANKSAEADRAAQLATTRAGIEQNIAERESSDELARQQSALAASPLGANQQFAQRNAMLAAILPGLRNFSVGDKGSGQISGGLRLPEGGLDPAMLSRLFGDEATQASIAERAKAIGQVNPRAAAPPLEALYGRSDDGSQNAFVTDVQSANQAELARQMDENAKRRELIRRAIEQDAAGEKSGGKSKKSRLAGAGMGAATGFATGGPVGAIIGGLAGLF